MTSATFNHTEKLALVVEEGEQRELQLEELVRALTRDGKISGERYYELCKPKPPILYARKNPKAETPQRCVVMYDEKNNLTYTINISLKSQRSTVGIWRGKIPTPPPYFRITQGATLAQFTELPKLLFKKDHSAQEFDDTVREYASYLSMDRSIGKTAKEVVTLHDKFIMAFQNDLLNPELAFEKGEDDAIATGTVMTTRDHPFVQARINEFKLQYARIITEATSTYKEHIHAQVAALRTAVAEAKTRFDKVPEEQRYHPTKRLEF